MVDRLVGWLKPLLISSFGRSDTNLKAAPVTTSAGFYPVDKDGWTMSDGNINITTPHSGQVYIVPLELDAIDPDIDVRKMRIKISVSFKGDSGDLIIDPPQGTPYPPIPDKIGTVWCYQNFGRGQILPIALTPLYCDMTREDGLALSPSPPFYPAHRYDYTSTIGTVTSEFEIEPFTNLGFVWDVDGNFIDKNCDVDITISVDEIYMEGFAVGPRGRNELITLGKDAIGRASLEQEQAEFRPVFIYRYGDNYVYPKDPALCLLA